MRIQAAVVVLILTLVSSAHVTGQQEPLQTVRARSIDAEASALSVTPVSSIMLEEPTVIMPLVPLRENMPEPTLSETARDGDYEAFHSRYLLARTRGEQVAQYEALHELWSWSMSSPTGAFYGADLHARIAAAYPGFARYIDDYKIVDRNGNAFYPTAETRTYLLEQALRNTSAPRVQIARGDEAPRRSTITGTAPLAPGRSRSRTRMQKAEATPKPVEPKPAITPEPVQVATNSSSAVPGNTMAPPQVDAKPPVTAVQPPVTLATITPQPVKPIVPQPASRTGGRAVVMILVGLLGAGILAVLLRAPKEEPVTVLPPAQQPPQGEVAKVEPIRKAEGAEPQPQRSGGKKNPESRAHGSRR